MKPVLLWSDSTTLARTASDEATSTEARRRGLPARPRCKFLLFFVCTVSFVYNVMNVNNYQYATATTEQKKLRVSRDERERSGLPHRAEREQEPTEKESGSPDWNETQQREDPNSFSNASSSETKSSKHPTLPFDPTNGTYVERKKVEQTDQKINTAQNTETAIDPLLHSKPSNETTGSLKWNATVEPTDKSNAVQSIEPEKQPWVALCGVMKDEDLYLDEWTDYHLALGFEHIYIYDSHPNFTLATWYSNRQQNEATQAHPTDTTTQRVHLQHRVLPDEGMVQELVYGECLAELRSLAHPPKWVMILDGDEFLVFRDMDKYPDVTTFLGEHLHSGSLQINWVVMGSANETQYRDEPVTKRFQLAISGPTETKAVAVLDHVNGWRVHYAYHKPGYNAIGMGGRKVGVAGALCCIKDGDVSVAAIFHYKYKSHDEFNFKQCKRGDIYKAVKHTCPATVIPGNTFDDSAWRALTRLVPKYALTGAQAGQVEL